MWIWIHIHNWKEDFPGDGMLETDTQLRSYIPLDTKWVIFEMFFLANLLE